MMITGEKMIWAAAFARSAEGGMRKSLDERCAAERFAVESACQAVMFARSACDSEMARTATAATMLREMVGAKP